MTLVDTSSLVHLLRTKGERVVKERIRGLLAVGQMVICDMVILELRMGVGSTKDRTDVDELVELVECLPTSRAVWARAGRLASACRESGNPVPSSDVLIAACAFEHGVDLDAEDGHFALLAGFRSEDGDS